MQSLKRIKVVHDLGHIPQDAIPQILISQFKTPDINLEAIEFVFDESYDIIIFTNTVQEKIKKGSQAFIFHFEPSWRESMHQKSYDESDNITIFGFDKRLYQPNSNVIETFSHLTYGGLGPFHEGWGDWTYENVVNTQFIKNNKISCLISPYGLNENERPKNSLYKERTEVVSHLIKEKMPVDIFFWNKICSTTMPYIDKKIDGLKSYKFSLAIENANENFYITEKFYDCILTNTIPIYYGCKNISDIWPENGYILLESLEPSCIKEKITYINDNIDSLYSSMLPELYEIKKRYFEEYNILKKIIEL